MQSQAAESAPHRRLLQRPLQIGLSVGHPSGTCGSIGPFVRAPDGVIGFLSTASAIAPQRARPGDFIHQPSAIDYDLTGGSRVAELSPYIQAPQPSDPANTDAAVAWLIDQDQPPQNVIPPDVPDAGRRLTMIGAPIQPGDLVATSARSTPFNHGAVDMVAVDNVRVRAGRNTMVFNDCLAIRSPHGAFTRPGDSGALVWRLADGMALGIVFASVDGLDGTDPITFVLPLAPILARFNLQFA